MCMSFISFRSKNKVVPFKNPKAKTSPKISATQMEHQTLQLLYVFTRKKTMEDLIGPPAIPNHGTYIM